MALTSERDPGPALNVELLFKIGQVFDPRPDAAQYFPTRNSELLRQRLNDSLLTDAAVPVLMGCSGSGKSLLLGEVLRQQSRRWTQVAQLRTPAMDGAALTQSIARALGLGRSSTSEGELFAELDARLARGCRTLLVVDDAQLLSVPALGQLQRLLRQGPGGRPRLDMTLLGTPELGLHLSQYGFSAAFHPCLDVGSFEADESVAFVRHRLKQFQDEPLPAFTADALQEIHRCTAGVPGRIQLLCRELLHLTLLDDEAAPIDLEKVRAQAVELGLIRVAPPALVSIPAMPASPSRQRIPAHGRAPIGWLGGMAAGLAVAGFIAAIAMFVPNEVNDLSASSQREVTETRPASTSEFAPELALPSIAGWKTVSRESRVKAPQYLQKSAMLRIATGVLDPECSAMLTQLSLGEPLTSKQKHRLEAACP